MNKIPEINRARGYFLYTADGKRYLDMALEGGRLIMGHRQKGYGQALKNVIDKGILPGFPSPYAHRLKQAVKALFGSGCYVYLFKSEEHAKAALTEQGIAFKVTNARDPINDLINSSATLKAGVPVLPVLPIPAAFAPGVVVSKIELDLSEEPVSPVILAGAVRALYNLKAFLAEADYSAWEKAGITEVCKGKWRVELPYLYPLCTQDQYPAVWDTFFDAGIILSCDYDTPSILPPSAELSDGNRKKVLEMLGKSSCY